MYFTGKDDELSIEEYIKEVKSSFGMFWKMTFPLKLRGNAVIFISLLNYAKMKDLSNEEYEEVFLDRWSHVMNNDKKRNTDLFSCENLLQVHGFIQ